MGRVEVMVLVPDVGSACWGMMIPCNTLSCLLCTLNLPTAASMIIGAGRQAGKTPLIWYSHKQPTALCRPFSHLCLVGAWLLSENSISAQSWHGSTPDLLQCKVKGLNSALWDQPCRLALRQPRRPRILCSTGRAWGQKLPAGR